MRIAHHNLIASVVLAVVTTSLVAGTPQYQFTPTVGQIDGLRAGEDAQVSHWYAELQGSRFLHEAFGVALVYGYWTDGLSEPLPIMDVATYSYHDHRLGLRMLLGEPQRFCNNRLYYEVHVGAFQHFVYWAYLGGYSPGGDPVDTHWDGWLAAELGAWIGYSLGDRLDIGIQGLGEYRLMPSEKARYRRGRFGLTTGVRWHF